MPAISVAGREFVACLNLLKTGGGYPSDRLDQLWKETLLYQFHDILPGSSIKRVYDECEERYDAMLLELNQLILTQQLAVSGAMATVAAAVEPVPAAGGAAAGPLQSPLSLFNSLSWARQEWVQHEGQWLLAQAEPLSCAVVSGATDATALSAAAGK